MILYARREYYDERITTMETPKRNLDSTKPQRISDRYGVNTLNKGFYRRNGRQTRNDEAWLSPVRGLFLCSALFFYWEILTNMFTVKNIGGNIVYLAASSVLAAMVVSLISGIFENIIANYVISFIVKLIICVLFMCELTIFDISSSFFGMSSDISKYSFSGDVLPALARIWWQLLLMILPLIVSVVVYVLFIRIEEDILGYSRRNLINYGVVVLVAVIAYAGLILSVDAFDSNETPVSSVYNYDGDNYDESVSDFGIMTSMVHDAKWFIFDK